MWSTHLWDKGRRRSCENTPAGRRCNIAGTRVRTARECAGLSQEQLAAKIQLAGLDITQKQVSRIETGDRVVADYELRYLADALGVTVHHLLGIDE